MQEFSRAYKTALKNSSYNFPQQFEYGKYSENEGVGQTCATPILSAAKSVRHLRPPPSTKSASTGEEMDM